MNQIEKRIHIIASIILKLLHRQDHEKTEQMIEQFLKFGMVGVTNTLLSYGVIVLILKLLQEYRVNWDYIVANLIAFIISVYWSFYWNNKYVFVKNGEETRNLWKTLLKTYAAYGFTGIIVTNILSYFWIDVLGISKYIAPLINLIISVPLNFIINKFWAFKTTGG